MAALDPITGLPVTTPATAATAGFTPTTPAVQSTVTSRGIDPATQTVQGQMASMTDVNNPFYQKWSTAGKEMAATNGFTNGSMQQTGILNSVMQNATPIATTDAANANAVTNLNTVNQNASNTAYAGAQNQAKLQDSQQANSLASTNAQLGTTASTTNANNATSLSNAGTSAGASMSNSAGNVTGALTQTAVTEINRINMDQTMTPAAKQAAIAAVQSGVGAGSNVVSSIGKVGAMLNFNNPNGVGSTVASPASAPAATTAPAGLPASLPSGTPGLPTSNLTNGQVVSYNGANYQLTGYSAPKPAATSTGLFGNLVNYGANAAQPGTPGVWTKL